MHCSTCGNEIGAQALFCGVCGTPVGPKDPAAEAPLEAKRVPAQRRGRAARAAETAEATSDATPSRASFKGAMATSHKKARKNMPVLVLVAIAMLMSSAVAWAFYTLINPPIVNEREVDWTPETLYAALDPDRFDLEARLSEILATARTPSVRVPVPASIAAMEEDRLNFDIEDDDPRVVIYYRGPSP